MIETDGRKRGSTERGVGDSRQEKEVKKISPFKQVKGGKKWIIKLGSQAKYEENDRPWWTRGQLEKSIPPSTCLGASVLWGEGAGTAHSGKLRPNTGLPSKRVGCNQKEEKENVVHETRLNQGGRRKM